jgi:hypothetical protein
MERCLDQPSSTDDRTVWPWSRGAALLALCAYLLFAHGCHGDEDHELLSSITYFERKSEP